MCKLIIAKIWQQSPVGWFLESLQQSTTFNCSQTVAKLNFWRRALRKVKFLKGSTEPKTSALMNSHTTPTAACYEDRVSCCFKTYLQVYSRHFPFRPNWSGFQIWAPTIEKINQWILNVITWNFRCPTERFINLWQKRPLTLASFSVIFLVMDWTFFEMTGQNSVISVKISENIG